MGKTGSSIKRKWAVIFPEYSFFLHLKKFSPCFLLFDLYNNTIRQKFKPWYIGSRLFPLKKKKQNSGKQREKLRLALLRCARLHPNINTLKFQGLQPTIIVLHILRMQSLKGEKAEVWRGAPWNSSQRLRLRFHCIKRRCPGRTGPTHGQGNTYDLSSSQLAVLMGTWAALWGGWESRQVPILNCRSCLYISEMNPLSVA